MGLLAFFYNLPVSLFGVTEGLYASVTETMVRTGAYVHPTLHGEPYLHKPPMFFWLQAFSTESWGMNEAALRLPSAFCSFGTVVATYWIGRTLFSSTAGFWAALVMLTCYASVWFGQMAIIDPVLTFSMTLGTLGFVRAYFMEEQSWWYVIGFIALAFGAMVKNLHAFALPVALFVALLIIRRDGTPFKTRYFWLGIATFVLLVGGYYVYLGQEFIQHYVLKENLQRMTKLAGDTQGSALDAYFGKRPIVWYLFVIWFDCFPWSALLPAGLLLLWRQKPRRHYPRETFILLWVLGYILAFSLFPEKHERYLMPMIPGIALMIGYVYHRVFDAQDFDLWTFPSSKRMLVLLSLLLMVVIFLAPYLLEKKWNLPSDIFPFMYQVGFLFGAGVLMYAVSTAHARAALNMVGVLAVGLMMSLVLIIVPGINAVASPKLLMSEVQSYLKTPNDPIQTFQHWNWRSDEDLYYWLHVHKNQRIIGENQTDEKALESLQKEVRQTGSLVILMTEHQFRQIIQPAAGLTSTILREFPRPKRKILLVSIQTVS